MYIVKVEGKGYYYTKRNPVTNSVTFSFGDRDEATTFLTERVPELVVKKLLQHNYRKEDITVEEV